MDKQQQAPILTPFFENESKRISPTWQRWFQKLKTRDDEIRQKPYKTYTTDQALTTWELGKSVLFNIGTNDATATLPPVSTKDIWSWITILRQGTGMLNITAADNDYIERKGGRMSCIETHRIAANVTLQLVAETQWAIIGASGIWRVHPY